MQKAMTLLTIVKNSVWFSSPLISLKTSMFSKTLLSPKRLSLKENALKLKKIVKENLEKVGMGERYWQAKPKQLSGGQK